MKIKKINREKINKTVILDTPILTAKRDIKAGETMEVRIKMAGKVAFGFLESKDFYPIKTS